MTQIEARINERLAGLTPILVHLEDDSHLHAGHAGASGGGHYRLHIVAEAFSAMSAVTRHRTVYQLLSDLMQSEIHALSVQAQTPAEAGLTSDSSLPEENQ